MPAQIPFPTFLKNRPVRFTCTSFTSSFDRRLRYSCEFHSEAFFKTSSFEVLILSFGGG